MGIQSRRNRNRSNKPKPLAPTSWDAVAAWYDGWVGEAGSDHHRELAIPTLLDLLTPAKGENILDIGAGQGVLASYISATEAFYTGVDASPRLLDIARRRHGKHGRFLAGNACNLSEVVGLRQGEFDAVTFLLSIQDMNPLEEVIASAAWALKPGGRVALLLVHPAFRVPRGSGWGWDDGRKLRYRRVDSYLTPQAVPMKSLTNAAGRQTRPTRSFHRPMSAYINAMSSNGLLLERMLEIPAHRVHAPPNP
ncbi:MAG: class I SAM-dependent methyltransferase, partial [Chloroflexia bacterium]